MNAMKDNKAGKGGGQDDSMIFKNWLIYFWPHWVFIAVRGLSLLLCVGFSLVVESRGYSLVVVCRLLIVVAPLVVEHRL